MLPGGRPLLPVLLTLALAACATYRAEPLDPRALEAQWHARRLDDPALVARLRPWLPARQRAGWPPASWNRGDLLAVALALNPSLQESRAKLTEAVAAVGTARALPDPTVGLALEHYTRAQADASPWLWGISTDWLLDAPLRRRLRLQLADAGVRAARLDYAAAVWQVRDALRDALLARELATRQQQLARQAEAWAQELANAARQRRALGEDGPGTLLQATRTLADARATVALAAQHAAAATAALAGALGVPVGAVAGLAVDWPDFERPPTPDADTLARLRDRALLARPDLERALVAYQQRELELHQQVRLQYPQVSLGPGYTFDHGIRSVTFGLSAKLPLFNRNRGPIAEARARREAAAAHVRTVQANIDNRIDAATARLAAARRALAAADAGRRAAAGQRARAEHAFALGAIDRSELLTARLGENAAASARLTVLEQAWQARAALEDAVHAPLDPAEAELWPGAGEPR